MAVPYTFGTATASIPLSQLDSNFATVITLGNTAIQLGNTVTTLNNMTLANVTISSGNITLTNVSATTANVTTANVVTLIVTGNETVQGNTSVTGTATAAKLIPTGTSVTGNGMYLPATNSVGISTNGTNAVYIDASQNVGIGTSSPARALTISISAASDNVILAKSGAANSYIGFADSGTTDQTGLSVRMGSSGNAMVFQTGGTTERMRINAGAPILCLAGGSTTATGTGIAFPATQSASSDANTLDDYEEGTFTPSFSTDGTAPVISTSNAYGSYTKIGRMVNFIIHLSGTTVTSVGTGNMVIAGLPFGVAGDYATFPVGFVSGFTTNQPSVALGRVSLSNMWIYYRTAANGVTSNNLAAEAKTGMEIYISGQYQTNT